LAPPEMPMNTEETTLPKRVCDEAYMLLRQLCSYDGAEDAMVNERIIIYTMSEKERDAGIDRFLHEKKWISLQEKANNTPLPRD
jgi:hypothetical protein